MDKFVIYGGNELSGEVEIGGSKNAALPLIAAAILTPDTVTIRNVAPLVDVRTMMKLLRILGGECGLEDGTLKIDTSSLNNFEAPYKLVKTMRASIYVLGPLLARFGKAKVSLPGGCAWGPRPVNLHIEGMKKLGAEIRLEAGYIIAEAAKLKGERIVLDFPSVGATGNIMMAAVLADGETIIENAAREPDITALAEFLNKMGAEIEGMGTSRIKINGVSSLHGCVFDNIPDRIEAGTFLTAAAITGGKIKIKNCCPGHFKAVCDKLRLTGCEVDIGGDWVELAGCGMIEPVNVTTEVYPGFPTDMQAQWIALMSKAKGISRVRETIYPDRFTHVAELMRLGADIRMEEGAAVGHGVGRL